MMIKWKLLLTSLSLLNLTLPLRAEVPSFSEQALQARVESILAGTPWPGANIARPICATPVLVEFNARRNSLNLDYWSKVLSPEFRFPRPSGLDLPYNTPSGNFRIHYAVSGTDAVYQPGVDIDPADGVPDYVNLCGTVLDSCWLKEVTQLGYTTPPSDAFYGSLPGSPDNGGDGRYDIYLDNISNTGVLGYTAPETTEVIGSRRWTSFLVLRNDYSIYSQTNPLNLMRTTAAHELFHAIQFGLDAYEYEYYALDSARFQGDTLTAFKVSWMEMSAVWMEEQVYDDINDYRSFLPSFFAFPWLSLKTFTYSFDAMTSTGFHPYGSCVWPIFLSEEFGVDIIRSIWNKCAGFIGDNVFNDPPGRKSATREVLDSIGVGWEEAFREFTVWNYFTGLRSQTGFGYTEAADFAEQIDSFKVYQVLDDTILGTVDSVTHPPQNLGSNYLVFAPNPLDTMGGLYLSFQGIDTANWLGTSVRHSYGSAPTFKSFLYNPLTLKGESKVFNWKNYDEIVMILAAGNPLPFDDYLFNYKAFHDSSLFGVEGFVSADQIGHNFPNPFRLSESNQIYFPVSLSQRSFVYVDIFTISGQLVRQIRTATELDPGEYISSSLALSWDGKNQEGEYVSSGVYLCHLRTKNAALTQKIAVIR